MSSTHPGRPGGESGERQNWTSGGPQPPSDNGGPDNNNSGPSVAEILAAQKAARERAAQQEAARQAEIARLQEAARQAEAARRAAQEAEKARRAEQAMQDYEASKYLRDSAGNLVYDALDNPILTPLSQYNFEQSEQYRDLQEFLNPGSVERATLIDPEGEGTLGGRLVDVSTNTSVGGEWEAEDDFISRALAGISNSLFSSGAGSLGADIVQSLTGNPYAGAGTYLGARTGLSPVEVKTFRNKETGEVVRATRGFGSTDWTFGQAPEAPMQYENDDPEAQIVQAITSSGGGGKSWRDLVGGTSVDPVGILKSMAGGELLGRATGLGEDIVSAIDNPIGSAAAAGAISKALGASDKDAFIDAFNAYRDAGGTTPEIDLPKFETEFDLNLPDIPLPDLKDLDITVPEYLKMSGKTAFDLDLPELADINLPDVSFPDISLPDVNLPDIDIPDLPFELAFNIAAGQQGTRKVPQMDLVEFGKDEEEVDILQQEDIAGALLADARLKNPLLS